MNKRIFAVIALAASLVLAVPARAADDTSKVGLAVSPPTFEMAANPGDVLKNKIRVDNVTDDVLSVSIDRRNFTAAGEEGQAELTDEDTPYSLAKWISVSPTSVDIPAKSSQSFDFTISVPNSAEPGGHFGSVVFKTKARPLSGQTGVKIGQEVGSLIFLRVAGDIKQGAAIETFKPEKSFYEYGPASFETRVSNSGSVHFKPEGTITIANMFGQKVATLAIDGHNVLPGAIRKFTTDWKTKYLFGKYSATVSIKYGDDGRLLTATTTFVALPYKLVGIVLIVVILLLFFFIRRRKRIAKSFKILFGRD